MFDYDRHLEKCINGMADCLINVFLWTGNLDMKLKAEWDAAVLLQKPTILVVAGKDVVVPDFIRDHPIVRRTVAVHRSLTAADRERLTKAISDECGVVKDVHISEEAHVT